MSLFPFSHAEKRYADFGIDISESIQKLKQIPLSLHCWQGDDITGFDQSAQSLTGGIQVTGSYPYKARNFDELSCDIRKAFSFIPGSHRLNLHASYTVFPSGKWVDRDSIQPEHFIPWLHFAKEQGIGLDLNPTFFSHKLSDGMTLSHVQERIRLFWVRHAIACRRISAFFAQELDTYSLLNIWVPDGCKNPPADRMSPRLLLKESLDMIYAEKLEGVIDSVEGKLFGIGLESYTVGSHEFYLSYAASHSGVYPLLDSGHFHPTETIGDKIASLLCFFDKIPLHISHGIRWDSDHIARFNDDTRDIFSIIACHNALDKTYIGMDFFDASVNRIAAWVMGARNIYKAMLYALLTPHKRFSELQNSGKDTELLVLQEELKTLPFGTVWEAFCQECNVPPTDEWLKTILTYETETLEKRQERMDPAK